MVSGRGSQQAHTHPVQKALLGQLHGQSQASLAAEARKDAVRLLLLNNPLYRGQSQGSI